MWSSKGIAGGERQRLGIGPTALLLGLLFLLEAGIFSGAWAGGPQQGHESSTPSSPWASIMGFYARHISPVDGERCPSFPTCSAYSAAAVKKHGFVLGWIMTVDRLIHEADEASVSPTIRKGGKIRIYDPVENNDFWWAGEH